MTFDCKANKQPLDHLQGIDQKWYGIVSTP